MEEITIEAVKGGYYHGWNPGERLYLSITRRGKDEFLLSCCDAEMERAPFGFVDLSDEVINIDAEKNRDVWEYCGVAENIQWRCVTLAPTSRVGSMGECVTEFIVNGPMWAIRKLFQRHVRVALYNPDDI